MTAWLRVAEEVAKRGILTCLFVIIRISRVAVTRWFARPAPSIRMAHPECPIRHSCWGPLAHPVLREVVSPRPSTSLKMGSGSPEENHAIAGKNKEKNGYRVRS